MCTINTKIVPSHQLNDLQKLGFETTCINIDELIVANYKQLVHTAIFECFHRTSFFTVLLVIAGELKMEINFKEYIFQRNSLLIIKPHDLRRVVSSNKAIISVALFTSKLLINAGLLTDFDSFSRTVPHVCRVSKVNMVLINSLLEQVYHRNSTVKQHRFGFELLHATFRIFIFETIALFRNQTKSDGVHSPRKANLTQRFVQLAEDKFKELKQIKHYALLLHVNPKYLTQVVAEVTGKKPSEIIDELTIYESKLLLKQQQFDIAEIAYALGFSDPSSFGKYFKRLVGSSPKKYRLDMMNSIISIIQQTSKNRLIDF